MQVQHLQNKMAQLNKKVERLRAVLLTKEQVDAFVSNLNELGEFTSTDKEMMESFKKILSLGTKQLKAFVSELNSKGASLDEYSIIYYTTQLKNGPLKEELKTILSQGGFTTYWKESPDIIGVSTGPELPSLQETPIGTLSTQSTFNQPVATITKMPQSVVKRAMDLDKAANSVISVGINGCLKLEEEYEANSYNNRIEGERGGAYSKTAHGSYLVADTSTFLMLKNIRVSSSNVARSVLGSEDYRLYVFKRDYNPYDPAQNVSITKNTKVKRKVDINSNVEIETDLGGNVFEGANVRDHSITVQTQGRDATLKLHTVKGQLGDTEKVKVSPLNQ